MGCEAQAESVLQAIRAVAQIGERPALCVAIVNVLNGHAAALGGNGTGILIAGDNQVLPTVTQQLLRLGSGTFNGDDERNNGLGRHGQLKPAAVETESRPGADQVFVGRRPVALHGTESRQTTQKREVDMVDGLGTLIEHH